MPQIIPIISRVLILVLATVSSVFAQANPDWTEPFPPFRIARNLYYVGTKGLANYLITTPQGNILINSDLEANVPMIEASIEKLGFKFKDTKILLISHAHWDHDAGSAMIKEMTGAMYMVMDADVPVVESGGKTDFDYGNSPTSLYRPTKVDRVLHDGDEVKLGGTVLVAHLTPGHTEGCTCPPEKPQGRLILERPFSVAAGPRLRASPASNGLLRFYRPDELSSFHFGVVW